MKHLLLFSFIYFINKWCLGLGLLVDKNDLFHL